MSLCFRLGGMCVCIEITAVSCDQTRRDTVGRPFIFLPVCWLSSAAKTIKKQPLPPPYLGSIHSWGKATRAPSCRPSGAGPKRNFLPATRRPQKMTNSGLTPDPRLICNVLLPCRRENDRSFIGRRVGPWHRLLVHSLRSFASNEWPRLMR